jgi:hypothetical protein
MWRLILSILVLIAAASAQAHSYTTAALELTRAFIQSPTPLTVYIGITRGEIPFIPNNCIVIIADSKNFPEGAFFKPTDYVHVFVDTFPSGLLRVGSAYAYYLIPDNLRGRIEGQNPIINSIDLNKNELFIKFSSNNMYIKKDDTGNIEQVGSKKGPRIADPSRCWNLKQVPLQDGEIPSQYFDQTKGMMRSDLDRVFPKRVSFEDLTKRL